MIMTDSTQQSVLDAYETSIRLEAFIYDSKHLFNPGADGFYSLDFIPALTDDHQRLAEHLELMKSLVRMRSGYWQDKDIRADVELKNGVYRCTQKFTPKVEPYPEHGILPNFQQCSLSLYVNDDPTGQLYLNCSYLDVYHPSNGIDSTDDESDVPSCDFDW